MVAHGVVLVVPQVGLSMPATETKMPRVTSPSMPSQLESVYVPSGSSVGDGGAHEPQPVAPWQVRVPAQVVANGVMIVHGCVWPMVVASQSQAPLLGTHCLMT